MNPIIMGQMSSGPAMQHSANMAAASSAYATGGTLEGKHGAFWMQFEATFRQASAELQASGIAWMVDMMTPILAIVTIMLGFLMASGQLNTGAMTKYGGRTIFMLWLVVGGAWVGTINALVLEDFPNEIARRIHGGSAQMQAVEQFAVVDSMLKGMAATARGQATGPTYIAERGMIYLNTFVATTINDLMFFVWCAMRMMLYMVVTMGAFLLFLMPFDSTIGVVKQLFGKIIGLLTWQLAANVTIKVIQTGTIMRLSELADSSPKSLGTMIELLGDNASWNVGALIMFLLIPAFAGFGSGIVASQTAVQGMIFAGVTAGVAATRGVMGGVAAATNRTAARLYATTQPPRGARA